MSFQKPPRPSVVAIGSRDPFRATPRLNGSTPLRSPNLSSRLRGIFNRKDVRRRRTKVEQHILWTKFFRSLRLEDIIYIYISYMWFGRYILVILVPCVYFFQLLIGDFFEFQHGKFFSSRRREIYKRFFPFYWWLKHFGIRMIGKMIAKWWGQRENIPEECKQRASYSNVSEEYLFLIPRKA